MDWDVNDTAIELMRNNSAQIKSEDQCEQQVPAPNEQRIIIDEWRRIQPNDVWNFSLLN